MTKRTFLLISIILVLFSCEKKQSELEYEQSVVYEIFPALMDSLDFDFRLIPPPPPRPIFSEKGEIIRIDTTGMGKKLKEYEQKKAELKTEPIELVVAISDTVFLLREIDRKELLRHFSKSNLKLDNSNISSTYKIEIDKLITDENLKFKYLSEFPSGSAIWESEYPFNLSGITYLTRIQFDTTKSFGILESGMSCGRLCGSGVRVFIKKVNGKWIIDKLEETWIS